MEAQPAALKRAAGGQAFAAGKGVQGLAQSVWFNGLLQPAGSSWRQALVGGLQPEMQNLQVLRSPYRGAGLVTHLWVACSVGWPSSGQRLCIRGRESQGQGALVGALQSEKQDFLVLDPPSSMVCAPMVVLSHVEGRRTGPGAVHPGVWESEAGLSWQGARMGPLRSQVQDLQVELGSRRDQGSDAAASSDNLP